MNIQNNKCPECGTELVVVPGIGPYCPNEACPVGDDPALWDGNGNRAPGPFDSMNYSKMVDLLTNSDKLKKICKLAFIKGYDLGMYDREISPEDEIWVEEEVLDAKFENFWKMVNDK